jgi:hypothetical protein
VIRTPDPIITNDRLIVPYFLDPAASNPEEAEILAAFVEGVERELARPTPPKLQVIRGGPSAKP